MDSFSLRIKALRASNGYSLTEMASKLGVSRNAVHRWEKGETTPNRRTMVKVAKLFNRSVAWVAWGSAEDTPAELEVAHRLSLLSTDHQALVNSMIDELLATRTRANSNES